MMPIAEDERQDVRMRCFLWEGEMISSFGPPAGRGDAGMQSWLVLSRRDLPTSTLVAYVLQSVVVFSHSYCTVRTVSL